MVASCGANCANSRKLPVSAIAVVCCLSWASWFLGAADKSDVGAVAAVVATAVLKG